MNLCHKHISKYLLVKIAYILIALYFACHVCHKVSNLANLRQRVCLSFYTNLLQNSNYSKLLPVSQLVEDLYNIDTCLNSGEIDGEISKAVKATIDSCEETTSEYVCAAFANFALPFDELCKTCSAEVLEDDDLSYAFNFLCGATTVGYGTSVQYWIVDHVNLNIDFMFLVSALTSFLGIILMAIMEGYLMLNYLAVLKPQMWAEHNINYLKKILNNDRNNMLSKTVEGTKMSTQLYHTFFESKATGTRTNQKNIKELLQVFPDFHHMPISEMFTHVALSSSLNVSQVLSLVGYGYTMVVTPEFNLYFKGDILRDIFVIIDGYVTYDSITRRILCVAHEE